MIYARLSEGISGRIYERNPRRVREIILVRMPQEISGRVSQEIADIIFNITHGRISDGIPCKIFEAIGGENS